MPEEYHTKLLHTENKITSSKKHLLLKIELPKKTGGMLFRKMVEPRRNARSRTTETTDELGVKIIASLSGMAVTSAKNISPMTKDVIIQTLAANLAPLTFPAPNSMATRTLYTKNETIKNWNLFSQVNVNYGVKNKNLEEILKNKLPSGSKYSERNHGLPAVQSYTVNENHPIIIRGTLLDKILPLFHIICYLTSIYSIILYYMSF